MSKVYKQEVNNFNETKKKQTFEKKKWERKNSKKKSENIHGPPSPQTSPGD